MIGAAGTAVEVRCPTGVTLRRVTDEADVRAMSAMQDAVFGDPVRTMAHASLRRLARGDGMELWVAEAEGEIVSAGRLEPVPGTDFAGIWGGATREEWRGRGIYRALTAARARSALGMGRRSSTATPPSTRARARTLGPREGLHHDALPVGRRRVGAREHACCVACASVRECPSELVDRERRR